MNMKTRFQNRNPAAHWLRARLLATLILTSLLAGRFVQGQTNTAQPGCGCVWNTALLPIRLPEGLAWGGQIAFDGNCDLLVAGGFTGALYKVNHLTGAVTTLVSQFPNRD